MLHWIVPRLLLVSLLAMAASLWLRDRLPERGRLLESLMQEPEQHDTAEPPFRTAVGGIEYTVKPLYRYRLRGLVVSRHHADAWWDIVHRDWGDKLNIIDLCVIWGPNLRNDAFREIRFWSEVFTCNAGTESDEAWRQFEPDALSNNHLLTADPRIARALRSARVGDQIEIEGWLSEYSHQHGRDFRRGTSTVRTDRGDGACETIYVTSARLLREANRPWRLLFPLSVGGVALALLLWFRLPFRGRH